MSSTKIVIVVLILIAVVFALFVTKGALSDEQPKRGGKDEAAQFSSQDRAPRWSKTIDKLSGSMRPTLDLGDDIFPAGIYKVDPDEERPFRIAKFRPHTGSAYIVYVNATPDEGELKVQKIESSDFADGKKPSIVALKEGGQLTVSCTGTEPCSVRVVK